VLKTWVGTMLHVATGDGTFRSVLGLSFALVFAAALPAHAADNRTVATLTLANPVVTYTAGPFATSNPGYRSGVQTCAANAQGGCDTTVLNVDLPTGANPNKLVKVQIDWTNATEDFDLYISSSATCFDEIAASNGTGKPEVATFPAEAGVKQYRVCVISHTAAGGSINGTISLIDAPVDTDGDGVPDSSDVCPSVVGVPPLGCPGSPASGLPPRFKNEFSPPGLADGAGEPSIGFNPASGLAMFIAGLETDRVTFAEDRTDVTDAAGNPLPASCDALWQDRSAPVASASLDPILFTDRITGRTFTDQLLGATSDIAFSNDDGESWTQGASLPTGGVDHQTVGGGPYPAEGPGSLIPHPGYDNMVFYCSQGGALGGVPEGNGFCQRSDDGGQTFKNGVITHSEAADNCQALHGHIKVAADGTAYLPLKNCGATAGVSISTDAGISWTVKKVTGSTPRTTVAGDSAIAVADDGTLYFCHVGTDEHPHVWVSEDKGDTWIRDFDLTTVVGVQAGVFPTVTAADGERAACAFLGTTTPGNYAAADFTGIWHPYVATTYDKGVTWHVVNVSPDDPVQGHGGICLTGTTCAAGTRNLLDFNDVTFDNDGRVLFAYADGCMGACVEDPTHNTDSDNGVIVRQTGGRTLHASFDDKAGTQYNSTTPIAPAAACARGDLSSRNTVAAQVVWTAPDTGGAAITNYKLYRGEAAAGPFTFIADTGPATSYDDATADPTVEKYYYKVVAQNAIGLAVDSNIIELPISLGGTASCELPGVLVGVESVDGACTGTGGGCTEQTDLEKLYIAELPGRPDDMVLTIKVGGLDPAPPPGTYWFFMTKKVDGTNLYFGMDTSQGAPRYTYGTYEIATLTTFTEQGMITGEVETDGHIHLFAPKTIWGSPTLDIGDAITSIEARTRVGASAGTSRDNIIGADYRLRGVDICAVPLTVLASLEASTVEGKAPLDVTFTISGTPSTGASLANYSLTFGDETGASPPPHEGSFGSASSVTVTHRYRTPGFWRARLTVTDSTGTVSSNVAEKTLTVNPGGAIAAITAATGSNNRLGGSIGLMALLALGLSGLLRLRRGGR
jgi:hypothetical protein